MNTTPHIKFTIGTNKNIHFSVCTILYEEGKYTDFNSLNYSISIRNFEFETIQIIFMRYFRTEFVFFFFWERVVVPCSIVVPGYRNDFSPSFRCIWFCEMWLLRRHKNIEVENTKHVTIECWVYSQPKCNECKRLSTDETRNYI